MTGDDNSSLASSPFEPKNWERVQGGDDDDSKNSTGDSKLSEEAFSKSTSVTDAPDGLASGITTLNLGGVKNVVENERATLDVSYSATTGTETSTDSQSGKDANKSTTKNYNKGSNQKITMTITRTKPIKTRPGTPYTQQPQQQ